MGKTSLDNIFHHVCRKICGRIFPVIRSRQLTFVIRDGPNDQRGRRTCYLFADRIFYGLAGYHWIKRIDRILGLDGDQQCEDKYVTQTVSYRYAFVRDMPDAFSVCAAAVRDQSHLLEIAASRRTACHLPGRRIHTRLMSQVRRRRR